MELRNDDEIGACFQNRIDLFTGENASCTDQHSRTSSFHINYHIMDRTISIRNFCYRQTSDTYRLSGPDSIIGISQVNNRQNTDIVYSLDDIIIIHFTHLFSTGTESMNNALNPKWITVVPLVSFFFIRSVCNPLALFFNKLLPVYGFRINVFSGMID